MWSLVVWAVIAVAVSCASAGCEPVVILPIGDSLTQGMYPHGSYRRWLWQKLAREDVRPVRFAGSQRASCVQDRPWEDHDPAPYVVDTNHEGHCGWDTEKLLEEVGRLQWSVDPSFTGDAAGMPVSPDRVDVALLHVGAEDVLDTVEQKHSGSQFLRKLEKSARNIRGIASAIRRRHPRCHVFVAEAIAARFAKQTRHFNSLIRGMARANTEPWLHFVNFSKFRPQSHTYDKVHPNEDGERLIADVWYNAILPYMPEPRQGPDCSSRRPAEEMNDGSRAVEVVDSGVQWSPLAGGYNSVPEQVPLASCCEALLSVSVSLLVTAVTIAF
eukprot:gene17546-27006_t